MPELADIFRCSGPEYLARFGDQLLPSQRRAIRDIIECRTAAMGGQLVLCDHCGAVDYSYHSCKNRGCPKCHGNDTGKWLEKRQAELLPVPYYHVVFTLPRELRAVVRRHQKTFYSILFKAAAQSLLELAADPKHVGGQLGLLAVLHTWTRAMLFHPHAHFLVPAGALAPDRQSWLQGRKKYLVPVKALSSIFRAKLMQMARKALPKETFPQAVWEKDWVVYCKPSLAGPEKVLSYLARYVHRIAITNNRILAVENDQVTFKYKDNGKQGPRWRTMTLPALEFMRRYLQHVPPRGFHRVRYYGFLSPACRSLLRFIKLLFASRMETENQQADKQEVRTGATWRCRHCQEGQMLIIGFMSRSSSRPQPLGRSPP